MSRRWLAPVLGLGVGSLLVVGLELGLRAAEPPQPTVQLHMPQLNASGGTFALSPDAAAMDPYISKETEDGLEWTTLPQLTRGEVGVLQRAKFLTPKPEDVLRVFVVGGSEVYGIPVEKQIELTYPGQLQARLAAAFPDKTVEVINSGVVGQESAQMLLMYEFVAKLEPDAIVFTGGGNDYRWYMERAAQMNMGLWDLRESAEGLASFRLIRRLMGSEPAAPVVPDDPVDAMDQTSALYMQQAWDSAEAALFDWPEGGVPARADRDDANLGETYQRRMSRMVSIAEKKGFVLVLAPPPTNPMLPPQLPVFDPRVGSADRAAIQGLLAAGGEENARAALALDKTYASSWFVLGEALDAQGRRDEAWDAFELSGLLDVGYLRVPRSFQFLAQELCDKSDAICVDTYARFRAASKDGQYAREFFHSPTHLSVPGQALIAELVADALTPALKALNDLKD